MTSIDLWYWQRQNNKLCTSEASNYSDEGIRTKQNHSTCTLYVKKAPDEA